MDFKVINRDHTIYSVMLAIDQYLLKSNIARLRHSSVLSMASIEGVIAWLFRAAELAPTTMLLGSYLVSKARKSVE